MIFKRNMEKMDIEKYGCKCIGISITTAPFCAGIKCHFFRYLCSYSKTKHSLLQDFLDFLSHLFPKVPFIDFESVFSVNVVNNKLTA